MRAPVHVFQRLKWPRLLDRPRPLQCINALRFLIVDNVVGVFRRKIYYMHRRYKFMSRWVLIDLLIEFWGTTLMLMVSGCMWCVIFGGLSVTIQDGEENQQISRMAASQTHEVWQQHPPWPGGERELYRPLQSLQNTSVSVCVCVCPPPVWYMFFPY